MSHELPRVTPAEAGLSGQAILQYIDNLLAAGTEMHGLMIARDSRVCAEGWWKPYAPGLIHGLQSLSKSYVCTAIGLLQTSGQLSLDEKLIDILPEYLPPAPAANLIKVTVHDLLCMGAGNNSMQDRTKLDWLNDFFSSEFPNEPGTRFFYSGLVTSVLGAIVRKKTGQGLVDFLRCRLFDKIGIDTGRLKWLTHPDGLEYGGGGLFATTEDNLRLGLLYLNEGIWQGERILSREWIREATRKQIDTAGEGPADNSVGYGYQMWMCQPDGVYRFDGAYGQFVIVAPALKLVIAINQTGMGPAVQKTLDATWKYMAAALGGDDRDERLAARLSCLSLTRPPYSNLWRQPHFPAGRAYRFEPNDMDLWPAAYRMLSYKTPSGIEQITFNELDGEMLALFRCRGRDYPIRVSLDGIDRLSQLALAADMPDKVYASGAWRDETTLALRLHYIETCFVVEYMIRLVDSQIEITTAKWQPIGSREETQLTLRSC
jgi:CubicO group peptidase (beta-lactamase class C family)